MQQPHRQFAYFAGCGNGYTIAERSFKYDPVTPERSSTGTYSGGVPIDREITDDEFVALSVLFDKAVAAKDQHQEEREKMTGLVFVTHNGSDTARVILKSSSLAKRELENYLVTLKSR